VPVAVEVGSGWCSRGGVGILWYWFFFLFCFLSPDSVIQPLEEGNKFLKLLRDVVRQGKDILDFVVQAPGGGRTFCRVVPLNVRGIALEFSTIGGEVAVFLLQHLQFSFCCRHTIWVPNSHFQTTIKAGTSARFMPLLVI
jgi:hypothetical protein